jgi:hypothetical protein
MRNSSRADPLFTFKSAKERQIMARINAYIKPLSLSASSQYASALFVMDFVFFYWPNASFLLSLVNENEKYGI